MERKYFQVSEVAEAYGMNPYFVRQLCRAKGQRFASKPNGGKIYINIKEFDKWLANNRPENLRRIKR